MRVLVLLVVLVAAVQAVAAQDVQLGGWALPEGSVVESVVALDARTRWTLTGAQGRVQAFVKYDAMRDTVLYAVTEVADGDLRKLTETHVGGEWHHRQVEGSITVQDQREPVVGVGHPVGIERTLDGWRYTPTTDSPPEDLVSLLDGLQGIPPDAVINLQTDRSARVGESWEVPLEVQLQMRSTLLRDRAQQYQVRLDSVGTWRGYPAAFLSTATDQITTFGEGTRRIQGKGRYVRRLDARISVVADLDQSIESEAPGTFSDGSPFQAVLRGTLRIHVTQSVHSPE